jgi:TRAP-type transport system small permease protein
MNGIRTFDRILRRVEILSAGLAASIILALMVLVVSDVLGRKLFNAPVQGTIEIASLTLPAIVFLTMSYIQSMREHVTIDIFTERLSRTTQQLLDIFGLGVAVSLMVIVIFKTTGSAWTSTRNGEFTMGIVQVPVWPARILVAYGSGLFFLRLLHDLISECASLFRAPGRAV